MSKDVRKPNESREVPTTGHKWDGIEEYDNPMPRWWLIVFYLTIIWGIIFTLLRPSWPGITGAWPGLLHYSSRGEVAQDIARVDAANAAINDRLAAADLDTIASDPELMGYAVNAGAAVFRTWCAQCHGAGAGGATGFPALVDDDWLWGGTMSAIRFTVTHGIRNQNDPEARFSQMPAFGALLEKPQIAALANYVMSLSVPAQDPGLVAEGRTLFEENCVACHGEEAKGNRELGAPDLTDAIWLYGGSYGTLVETITKARFGVMPNWNARLDDAQINAVTVYVHGLGGGQ